MASCVYFRRETGSGENTRATRRTREGSGALVRILRVSRVYFPALVPSVNSEYQSNYSEESQQEHALRWTKQYSWQLPGTCQICAYEMRMVFASHWLKNWRETLTPIPKLSKRNHVITFAFIWKPLYSPCWALTGGDGALGLICGSYCHYLLGCKHALQ